MDFDTGIDQDMNWWRGGARGEVETVDMEMKLICRKESCLFFTDRKILKSQPEMEMSSYEISFFESRLLPDESEKNNEIPGENIQSAVCLDVSSAFLLYEPCSREAKAKSIRSNEHAKLSLKVVFTNIFPYIFYIIMHLRKK